jgi:hypothetical protein
LFGEQGGQVCPCNRNKTIAMLASNCSAHLRGLAVALQCAATSHLKASTRCCLSKLPARMAQHSTRGTCCLTCLNYTWLLECAALSSVPHIAVCGWQRWQRVRNAPL